MKSDFHCECGKCKTCTAALKAHSYWLDGPGKQKPEVERPVVARGKQLSRTFREVSR